MNKALKISYCIVFFALVALPMLYFCGAKESWTSVCGWESEADVPAFTFASFTNRTFQTVFAERYSKKFFLRASFLRTAYQLREISNFGLFHYGYGNSILEGRDGVLFERPYADYHLTCPRPGGKAKYAEVVKVIRDMYDFCRTNGIDFVYLPMPDKLQAYPEYLPRWLNWFWNYSNYDSQAELAGHFRDAGIPAMDMNRYLMERKLKWETWVYPPGGTHFNAYGNGLMYNGFLETFVDTGKIKLKSNRFLGVKPMKEVWYSDDDISELLNLWHNPHLKTNPHYRPLFEQTNAVVNAGSLVTIGDCYREQFGRIFADAKFFAKDKVLYAPRGEGQNPEDYKSVAGDLRLVLLTFQSFNTGRLDDRRKELSSIFDALKTAYLRAHGRGKGS